VCFVQEGMLPTKLGEGARHPFIRALGDAESVVDATLGLANDALHAAIALRCRVVGVEGSPLLHALLEEGVARFERKYGVRIELRFGDAREVLSGMEDRSSDVVFLDPMMSRAKKSAPAFELVRQLAVPDRASAELLSEAARVARRRVVLKLGKGAPLPADSPIRFSRFERGAHVIYWVHDVD
jgi:16S rRNA (guanine1516-N2)-methyltransferase